MIAAALLAAALLAGCGGSGGGGGAGVTAQAEVTISSARQYQRIAGFGVSEGFGQAKTLMSEPASVQQQVLSLLYSPTRGAGLTILRNEISADPGFTIEPRAPGSPAGKPSYLTLAEVGQDQGQLWFAKQIKADGSPSSGFTWAQNIYTGLTAADLGAFLYLWGENTSPSTVTGGVNGGLVDVKGNTVAASGRLWAFASYSRFIRPGAVRIGTTTSDTSLDVTAFRNSDGSTAVTVLNSARSRQVAAFSLPGLGAAHITPYLTDTSHELSAQSPITVRNSAFTATLPPRSLVTYDIRS